MPDSAMGRTSQQIINISNKQHRLYVCPRVFLLIVVETVPGQKILIAITAGFESLLRASYAEKQRGHREFGLFTINEQLEVAV